MGRVLGIPGAAGGAGMSKAWIVCAQTDAAGPVGDCRLRKDFYEGLQESRVGFTLTLSCHSDHRDARAGRSDRSVRRHGPKGDEVLKVDAKRLARGSGEKNFKVVPGDTITVGESIF